MIFVQLLKLINFLRIRPRLMDIHVMLRHLDGRLQSQEEYRIIEDNIRWVQGLFQYIIVAFLGSVAVANIIVLKESNLQMPFQVWIPWDWHQSFSLYLLTLCLLNIGLVTMAFMGVGNDTYPVAYLKIVAAHWKALAIRIARVGNTKGTTRELSYSQLIECVESHQIILQLRHILEDSLSFACFIQCLCTATAICTQAVFAAQINLDFFRIVYVLIMLVNMLTEMYIVCYASELVQYEAEQMTKAIYNCNWVCMPVEHRRIVLIMLMRSQRSAGIMAIGYLPVSMTTLLSVVKGAYSVYTLLNQMNSMS
ncbi:odorant receptor 19a [Drosophila grimshawi]|nr:odorant receptor 19a [Drosophila grimshawi]